jgi:hypothetical protein
VFTRLPSFVTTVPVPPTTCEPIITTPTPGNVPLVMVTERRGITGMVEVVLEMSDQLGISSPLHKTK